MKTKPQTNTQRILNKIDGEIFTTKNWEAHISAHSNDGEKKYTTLITEEVLNE